ncbi:hypothetical protein N0V88_000500 [Collariella sp. IMI 366227]|nr:hypothetical protein N0V88_000500 [Collariella sp. IMI 366227]
MNREIPGYYFDPVKRKYFRIESKSTAPSSAAWSAENVKRRAVQEEVVKAKEKRARREVGKIKRARILTEADVPLMGGLLAQEINGTRSTISRGQSAARAWAAGFRKKGEITPWPWAIGRHMVSAMWVGDAGDGKSETGVAYTVIDGSYLTRTSFHKDEEDRLTFRRAAEQLSHVHLYPGQPSNFHSPAFSIKIRNSKLFLACNDNQGNSCRIKQYTLFPDATMTPNIPIAGLRIPRPTVSTPSNSPPILPPLLHRRH